MTEADIPIEGLEREQFGQTCSVRKKRGEVRPQEYVRTERIL